ncbi:unnamed protein product [Danaus chrysippus]|uniref:(African queen) hypothetical protein n=1 Tax=Danaus chrysippus TaxID=151541 RepID=A0A8J2W9Q4_9NEOP|nr:unnamed protein product [Danaus chrysippus]
MYPTKCATRPRDTSAWVPLVERGQPSSGTGARAGHVHIESPSVFTIHGTYTDSLYGTVFSNITCLL